MGFFEENWFWRGTQSAIFYYVSCAPCAERKYKRRRKNEATRATKEKEEIVANQPGIVQQPAAFQTNEDWVEEILMGPGPPKGWKRDAVAGKNSSNNEAQGQTISDNSTSNVHRNTCTWPGRDCVDELTSPAATTADPSLSSSSHQTAESETAAGLSLPVSGSSEVAGGSRSHLSDSSSEVSDSIQRARPPLERRFSSAIDNLRDTIRLTMRPETWNWIRYERDDEILTGFNQRMSEMWNKATTSLGMTDKGSNDNPQAMIDTRRRRGSGADAQQRVDYQKYARNPEVNELHPPVVSFLPPTRDQAAWMTLPPPSAAVMEGKVRPQDSKTMRWPLARIERTAEDWTALHVAPANVKTRSGSDPSESIPELSDSITEGANSSDEEIWNQASRRHSLRKTHGAVDSKTDWGHSIGGAPGRDPARPWLAKSSIAPEPISGPAAADAPV